MKKIEICEMTLKDFAQIENILISDFDDFWTPSLLKSEIMGNNRKYIVAKQNDKIVGFAGIMMNFNEAEIMNIVTKKSERGNGIGKILLEKIIEIAKKNCIETIFLEVHKNNQMARKMYENAGFIEIGERKNYYHSTEKAILMSKNLKNL